MDKELMTIMTVKDAVKALVEIIAALEMTIDRHEKKITMLEERGEARDRR